MHFADLADAGDGEEGCGSDQDLLLLLRAEKLMAAVLYRHNTELGLVRDRIAHKYTVQG